MNIRAKTLSGGKAIIEAARANGMTTLFGVPGAQIYPLFDALHGTDVELIVPRHEQAAAYMAMGYAKSTGIIAFRNGVQFGTGGGQGLLTDASNPINEIRIGGDDTNGYAPVDIHEVVITEGRDLTQLAAYRSLRVAPLYGITVQ